MARAKAQKLIRGDVQSDLLQTLEMHVGVILGHLNELERARCVCSARTSGRRMLLIHFVAAAGHLALL